MICRLRSQLSVIRSLDVNQKFSATRERFRQNVISPTPLEKILMPLHSNYRNLRKNAAVIKLRLTVFVTLIATKSARTLKLLSVLLQVNMTFTN